MIVRSLKVRAADLVGAYGSKGYESEENENGTLEVGGGDNGEVFSEEDEARGVLYCDIGAESNGQAYAKEAVDAKKRAVGVGNEE